MARKKIRNSGPPMPPWAPTVRTRPPMPPAALTGDTVVRMVGGSVNKVKDVLQGATVLGANKNGDIFPAATRRVLKIAEFSKPSSELVKLDTCPTVTLIVSDSQSAVHGVLVCQSKALTDILHAVAKTSDNDRHVTVVEQVVSIVGQTVYAISYEYLVGILVAFYPQNSWASLQQFRAGITDMMKFHAVVSY